MSANTWVIDKVVSAVNESLKSDLVSAGELEQIIANELSRNAVNDELIKGVLAALIAQDSEIGNATPVGDSYVKFTGWIGSVKEKCERAIQEAHAAAEGDRMCAYWLCLKKNVDEYEAHACQ